MPSPAVLSYGNPPQVVDLRLGSIVGFRQRAVYDDFGTRYLYTHFDVAVRFVVHQLVSQPPGVPAPPARPSTARQAIPERLQPGGAIAAMRTFMLLPQQLLTMRIGDDILLESPQRLANGRRMSCDANSGPHPISFDIDTVLGTRTALGTYRIETWLDERQGQPGAGPPLLVSHNWESTEDTNEEMVVTRTTTGRMVFRRDFMEFLRRDGRLLVPNDFRGAFFHPVPPYYQRVRVRVVATGDGTSLRYTITDRSRNWGIFDGGVLLSIEGRQTHGYRWDGTSPPSGHRQLELNVTAYPEVSTGDMVSALTSLLASIRVGDGQTFADRFDWNPNAARRPLSTGEITVEFPARHASLRLTSHYNSAFGALHALFGANIARPDTFVEDFGNWGGPATFRNPGLEGGNDSTMDPLVGLVTQMLDDPSARPTLPAVPPPGFDFTP